MGQSVGGPVHHGTGGTLSTGRKSTGCTRGVRPRSFACLFALRRSVGVELGLAFRGGVLRQALDVSETLGQSLPDGVPRENPGSIIGAVAVGVEL